MSEQEEYLDRLLNGINKEPEDALEEVSFEDEDLDIDDLEGIDDMDDIEDLEGMDDIDDLEDIDEALFLDEDDSEFEGIDSQISESMSQEPESGLEASEFDFQEENFLPDEEDSDFTYENAEEDAVLPSDELLLPEEAEDLDPVLDASEEGGEEPQEAFDSSVLEEPQEQEELQTPEAQMPEEPQLEELQPEELQLEELQPEEPQPEEAQLEELQPEEVQLEELQPEEPQLEETQLEEPELQEADEAESITAAAEEESVGDETEPGEISDAEALANILNGFSDEETEAETSEDSEAPLAEEAVLDAPQDLGLELEEVDELVEDLEEAPKKKKEKKKKEKKKKEKKKAENQEKKPSLLKMLLEDEEEELTPEELEAEAAKKAEMEEKKQAKKAAAEEKKQQAKEAAAAKKAEKEAEKKRKKEAEEPPEPWPVVTKKIMPLIFLFGATFVAVIVILSGVLSYSPYVSNARQYFDNRQYGKAYEQLMGIHIKDKDEKFYNQVLLMNQLQVKVTSSKNHLSNGEKELALNDLVQAVLFYNDNLDKAQKLGLENEFQIVYASIEADLSAAFGISVAEAAELGAVSDAAEYQQRVSDIVN